jgi:sterol desaturase/sphingolipid hydroxylase (fatty acid hydroxylase superfamily)
VAVAVAHGLLWSLAHREMHYPRNAWFARTRWFRFLRRHHQLHHQYPGSNFAALLPPALDWLMGTWRRWPA